MRQDDTCRGVVVVVVGGVTTPPQTATACLLEQKQPTCMPLQERPCLVKAATCVFDVDAVCWHFHVCRAEWPMLNQCNDCQQVVKGRKLSGACSSPTVDRLSKRGQQ